MNNTLWFQRVLQLGPVGLHSDDIFFIPLRNKHSELQLPETGIVGCVAGRQERAGLELKTALLLAKLTKAKQKQNKTLNRGAGKLDKHTAC